MAVSSPARAITIFISHSPRDQKAFEDLNKHLYPLNFRYPTLSVRHSTTSDKNSTAQHLNRAGLIIPLVSPDYFITRQDEMQQALAQQQSGQATIVPILLRATRWESSPLYRYSWLPADGRPIMSRQHKRDEALAGVVQSIEPLLDTLQAQMPEFSPSTSLCEPPYPYDDFFTNREDILSEIRTRFDIARPHRTPIVALSGEASTGKTSIALEYCYLTSVKERVYQEVFWFNASSRTALGTAVGCIAGRLALPDTVRENEQQLFSAVRQWLREQPGWLLVLDAIEEMSLIDLLVPPISDGHVLLTTRRASTQNHGSLLHVSSMNVDAGALLLLRRLQIVPSWATLDQAPPDATGIAREITRGLRGSPTAIEQTSAYIQERQIDLATYLTLYQRPRAQQSNEHEPAAQAPQGEKAGVLALTLAELQGSRALDLLYLLAFLSPDAIPIALLLNGAGGLRGPLRSLLSNYRTLHRALNELHRFSLVQYHSDSAMLRMQQVTQNALMNGLTDEQRHRRAEQALKLVNHAFPEVRFDTRAVCARYLPQAERCAELIDEFQLTLKEGALLLERLGSFCFQRASYAAAEQYLKQALDLYERYLQTDTLAMAQTLNSLGRLYRRRGRYKEAEMYHRRALELRERALGSDDPLTAQSLHNLALVQQDLGNYQQAEELYRRVLAIEERTKGPDDPDVADTLNNLALAYSQQGRYAEAEETYNRALAIYRRTRDAGHPDLAYPLSGLGTLAEKRGDYEQAEAYYQQALAIRKRAFGKKHPDVARSITRLAGLAVVRGDYTQAARLYRQALRISKRTLGLEHPEVGIILNDRGLLARIQGEHARARLLFRHALHIFRLVLGAEHPNVASALNNLGQLARMTGNEERAERLLRRALAIREKVLGSTHPALAQSLGNLADLLAERRKDSEAEELFQRAFALYLQLPAPAHPDIERIPVRYAALLERLGKHPEAWSVQEAAQKHGGLSTATPEQDAH